MRESHTGLALRGVLGDPGPKAAARSKRFAEVLVSGNLKGVSMFGLHDYRGFGRSAA